MEILQTFNVSVSNKQKMSDEKIIFAVNLPSKLYHATVGSAGTKNLNYTLFVKYLDHMLAKFEPNRKVRNQQKFELFDKNKQTNK